MNHFWSPGKQVLAGIADRPVFGHRLRFARGASLKLNNKRLLEVRAPEIPVLLHT